jgi:hypothetical protein
MLWLGYFGAGYGFNRDTPGFGLQFRGRVLWDVKKEVPVDRYLGSTSRGVILTAFILFRPLA